MSKCCLAQQQGHLQGVQRRTASLIGAQAERGSTTKLGPCCGSHIVVHLSVLQMGSSASLPPYPFHLYFWMYYFYSPNHRYMCSFSLLVYFLTWLCSHTWMLSSMYCQSHLCVFSFRQLPTSNYKAL